MQTIYRVQNIAGEGPYINSNSVYISDWATNDHTDKKHHEPINDQILRYSDIINAGYLDYKFGFESETKLNDWFNSDERRNLEKLGFHVVKLRAETVIHGDKQSIFKGRVELC